jgi:hypothetical protein
VAAGLAPVILFVGALTDINQIALGLATATLMASEVAERAHNSLQVSGEATGAVAAIDAAMEEIQERVTRSRATSSRSRSAPSRSARSPR